MDISGFDFNQPNIYDKYIKKKQKTVKEITVINQKQFIKLMMIEGMVSVFTQTIRRAA